MIRKMRLNTAEILCVGTELLLGDIVNTDAAFISRRLAALGINQYSQSVVGDNPERLKSALSLAISRSDLVILTGGLGPTYDDLTKETAAELMSRKLFIHEESLERLRARIKRAGHEMTENNKKQALIPEGSVVFRNDYGTAPGMAIEDLEKGKIVILLPGPRASASRCSSSRRSLILKSSRITSSSQNALTYSAWVSRRSSRYFTT